MRGTLRLVLLGVFAGTVVGCDDPVCAEGATAGVRLTVHASDGTDLSATTMVWAVRIANPTVDSLESRLAVAGGEVRFTDVPGTYRLRIRHVGYAELVQTVEVRADDDGCGAELQHINVTLQPVTVP